MPPRAASASSAGRGLRRGVAPCFGLAIFVGLPLAGWGVNDVRGFFDQPARLVYVSLVVMLHVAALRFPAVGRTRKGGEAVVERQRIAVALLQLVGVAMLVVGPYCDRRSIAVIGGVRLARYFGLGIFASGLAAALWAEIHLADQFSLEIAIQAGHRLVADGPYRYLRHPRYLGILAFAAGFSLVYRSWLALLLAAAMVPVLVWRIHDEEALLRRAFGTDWEAYSKRSWRLVPFVY